MALSDSELVEQIHSENSRKAFDELISRYQLRVMRICHGFVLHNADAEDLTQDVFIEVFRSIDRFRGDSQFSTWLYRIAVNKSLNFLKKKKREKVFQSIEGFFFKGDKEESLQLSDEGQFAADRGIKTSENKKILKGAINSLPENQRTAFILAKYQDLSYKEIAEVMDLSISSVESLLFRAKGKLQNRLLSSIEKK
jgi:RNA polymerase sigma-70 factor (ECF subfamily)